MLIIDKRTDYYDSMAYAYGIDNKRVFVRDFSEVVLTSANTPYNTYRLISGTIERQTHRNIKQENRLCLSIKYRQILVFCGKVYPFTETEFTPYAEMRDDNFNIVPVASVFKYGYPEIDPKRYYFHQKWENLKMNENLIVELGHLIKSPYFVIGRYTNDYTIRVPLLRDINFHEIMPADECYQQIEMKINEMSNIENNMVVVSNDVRIEQHGFDIKDSFRTRK